ncbi:hypothetical protein K466DRAFT_268399 [Polyporus arcularius HHB13444]|uniref:Uncharacterized protein n=1 Tax=Polyporus arcularius HHB13444 TaxID=1314778 RepID=A0A5C3P0S3_9APHY|nr:hypothetical protein K466DRAFT_268399 [Polyporus arcularius HHB13444]
MSEYHDADFIHVSSICHLHTTLCRVSRIESGLCRTYLKYQASHIFDGGPVHSNAMSGTVRVVHASPCCWRHPRYHNFVRCQRRRTVCRTDALIDLTSCNPCTLECATSPCRRVAASSSVQDCPAGCDCRACTLTTWQLIYCRITRARLRSRTSRVNGSGAGRMTRRDDTARTCASDFLRPVRRAHRTCVLRRSQNRSVWSRTQAAITSRWGVRIFVLPSGHETSSVLLDKVLEADVVLTAMGCWDYQCRHHPVSLMPPYMHQT